MIQWYPGHMARAKRKLKEDLKLVDIVIELLDARIPESSSNPDLKELLHNKKKIVALNKIDLASDSITEDWKKYLKKQNSVVGINSLKGEGINELLNLIKNEGKTINKDLKEKGRNEREVRIMIIGIPNVGKSALINTLAGSNYAKTGNRPGVTRGKQWIKVQNKIQLLDTPGILWPKFDEEDVGYKLAVTGAISDDIFDKEMAAYKLIGFLNDINQKIIEDVYEIKIEQMQPYDILPLIGRKRGCLMSGGKVDRVRTSETLINDFRKGKLGKISLEKPPVEEKHGLE